MVNRHVGDIDSPHRATSSCLIEIIADLDLVAVYLAVKSRNFPARFQIHRCLEPATVHEEKNPLPAVEAENSLICIDRGHAPRIARATICCAGARLYVIG